MMKKRCFAAVLSLALLFAVFLPGRAMAASGDRHTNGVYAVSAESGYTLMPKTASGAAPGSYTAEIDGKGKTVYDGAEKLILSFTAAADEQYAVFLYSGNGTVPTDANLRYIDQSSGSGGNLEFTIYPDDLTKEGIYNVYVSSQSGGYVKAGSFRLISSYTEAGYKLGDVNGDNTIDILDALLVLNNIVGNNTLTTTQEKAADVNSDKNVDILDALVVLNFIVGNTTIG